MIKISSHQCLWELSVVRSTALVCDLLEMDLVIIVIRPSVGELILAKIKKIISSWSRFHHTNASENSFEVRGTALPCDSLQSIRGVSRSSFISESHVWSYVRSWASLLSLYLKSKLRITLTLSLFHSLVDLKALTFPAVASSYTMYSWTCPVK